LKHTKDFFEVISKKLGAIQKMISESGKENANLKNFQLVFNNTFEATEHFHQIFRETIKENQNNLRTINIK
jgi:hypothetical protein